MIAVIGLLCWTGLMMAVTYLSWTKMEQHEKVYLLLIYSAIFLSGVFYLFPLLKKLR